MVWNFTVLSNDALLSAVSALGKNLPFCCAGTINGLTSFHRDGLSRAHGVRPEGGNALVFSLFRWDGVLRGAGHEHSAEA